MEKFALALVEGIVLGWNWLGVAEDLNQPTSRLRGTISKRLQVAVDEKANHGADLRCVRGAVSF